MGKMLMRIICKIMFPVVDGKICLSNQLYGFRDARSTIYGIKFVTALANNSFLENGGTLMYCAVVTLKMHLIGPMPGAEVIGGNWHCQLSRCYYQTYERRKVVAWPGWSTKEYGASGLGSLMWNIMYGGFTHVPILKEGVCRKCSRGCKASR